MTSAMPDMPMPPIPMKWIVPMSVPTPFMRPLLQGLACRTQARARCRRSAARDRSFRSGRQIARRIRTAASLGAVGGIDQGARLHGQLLHLLGELGGGET